MNAAIIVGIVFIGALLTGILCCFLQTRIVECLIYDPKLKGTRVVFRPNGGSRYRLGVVDKMPSSKSWPIRQCVIVSGDQSWRVPLDSVVRVDELMTCRYKTPFFDMPLLRASCRGFSIVNAFFLNSLANGVADAIGLEVHLRIGVTTWQRALAAVFTRTAITFAVFCALYIVWGYGSNQMATLPNIILDAEATRQLFHVRLRDDEEFIVTEDNTMLFPTMRFRRGSAVKARLPDDPPSRA